jgi:hypothetical protein
MGDPWVRKEVIGDCTLYQGDCLEVIGIELDPDYFDIACERVQKAYDQPDLFVAPPKAPEQEVLDV